ncbi:LytTR family DNA-binding domain-containing protein [bacterium]|nr:LytTR family DNA-binding domain-containing protein [bacterium]MCI0607400.1 LytTR family DNA-binding domain-containing protein [bacterium]
MNQRIKTIIVDDEPLACRRIRRLLQSDDEVEVVAICTSGQEAVKAIEEHHPDLLFLDVQMPVMDGFGVLQAVDPALQPQIIFVTAYDQYAIQAFEVHALDYLLKPFDRERFAKSVSRAKEMIHQNQQKAITKELLTIRDELRVRPKYLDRLVIRTGGRIFFLKTQEIDWIEAHGKYVTIHSGKESHLLREGISSLEGDLNPGKFARIHRSTIVNVDRIKELLPWFHGDCKILLNDGTELMLSRHYRQRLDELLGRPL